ncbi:hypothetical protein L6452_38716 [Arctium lappa]|uniref:Uncharacterized protein n=1 Tax=Arctium lappa TaxID=4217 RepID=A0ACB8XR72_ARCLA|nr:hypothetical protein L6452_38716 [Arctium lappa]
MITTKLFSPSQVISSSISSTAVSSRTIHILVSNRSHYFLFVQIISWVVIRLSSLLEMDHQLFVDSDSPAFTVAAISCSFCQWTCSHLGHSMETPKFDTEVYSKTVNAMCTVKLSILQNPPPNKLELLNKVYSKTVNAMCTVKLSILQNPPPNKLELLNKVCIHVQEISYPFD